jgi:hypothetical protein
MSKFLPTDRTRKLRAIAQRSLWHECREALVDAADHIDEMTALAARDYDICWHCGTHLIKADPPRCEGCPEQDECDVSGCELPGCHAPSESDQGG